MAFTFKPNRVKLRTEDGTYTSPIVIGDASTAEQIAELEAAIDQMESTTIENITQIGNEIETKGQQTLDSIPEDYQELTGEVSDLKSQIEVLEPAATSTDVGKALIAKTVADGKVTEYEFGEAGGGISATAANLLLTILDEGIYGTDQSENIELLRKALLNIEPVSISAVLDSTPYVGLHYSDLKFIVTATFDDASTLVVDDYRVTTPGQVTSGSNTVTVRFRFTTCEVTFTASTATTYSITNTLSNVDTDNNDYLILAGERYEATLTVEEGYYLSSCTVTMGGVDITSTTFINNTVIIAEVTGDIAITAVASEYTYMDDLLKTFSSGLTKCNGYPNGSDSETSVIGGAYNFAPFVAEYPAKYDCTIHWKIKNITENDISLSSCGFGSIDCVENNIHANGSETVKAFYSVKADNSSHTLAPGGELEGTVTCKAGWQLCFICTYSDFEKFEIELVGDYVPETFDGYTEINPTTSNTEAYGNRRTVNYYSDNGENLIKTITETPRILDVSLDAGTYDVYCAVGVNDYTWAAQRVVSMGGGMSQNTDVNVYNSFGDSLYMFAFVWHHSQFTLSENGMKLAFNGIINDTDNIKAKIRFMFKKVVTE